jgi:hypothetical protein
MSNRSPFALSRRSLIAAGAALAIGGVVPVARAASGSGRFVELPPIPSAHVAPRRVTVWLPAEYDQVSWGFPVVYLHDGQLMADPDGGTFHPGIGSTLADLVVRQAAAPAIIVGIWSSADRLREFSPAAFIPRLPPSLQLRVESACRGPALSDAYLRYLAEELKPAIDRLLRTRPGPADTSILGSGMGGMAALYAVGRRPDLFGNAAWLADATPLVPYGKTILSREEVTKVERAFERAFDQIIPKAGRHRFYLDYGDCGTDLFAFPFQGAADPVLYERGYRRGRDLVCEGAPHPDFRRVSDDEKLRAALSLLLRPSDCPSRPGDD